MADTIVKTVTKTRKRGHGGSRKIGREAHDPAHQRYTAERRWVSNKARRIAKEARRQERLKLRKAA